MTWYLGAAAWCLAVLNFWTRLMYWEGGEFVDPYITWVVPDWPEMVLSGLCLCGVVLCLYKARRKHDLSELR